MTAGSQPREESKRDIPLLLQKGEIAWLLWYAEQHDLPVWMGMCSCTAAQFMQSIIVSGRPECICNKCGRTVHLSRVPAYSIIQAGDECLTGMS